MHMTQSRRRFLTTVSSAGAAGLLGLSQSFAQEAPPETTTVRFPISNNICFAPLYVADELLRAEGFTDIRYVSTASGAMGARWVARGDADFDNAFVGTQMSLIDAGEPITIVGGLHVGCYELFAHGDIRSIRDLKGRTVGVQHLGSSPHLLVSSMASYVGLDPVKEIHWVVSSSGNPMELFANGKIDAFLGFPPEPQELHARKIGRVIVNTAIDRPWSQYFCCVLAGNREFVRKHPVATKRVLRAIMKATDFCASEPDARRAKNRRWRVHRTLRLRAASARGNPLCEMARVRSRGYLAVLFPAPARSRHDKVDAQQDHRRRNGLASVEGAQARAEGLVVRGI